MTPGPVAVALVASLLLLPLAQGAGEAPSLLVEQDGVVYSMAAGVHGSGHVTVGPAHDGSPALPFDGCLMVQLRPEKDNGVILLGGALANGTVVLNVGSFSRSGGPQGGIATNMTLDGKVDPRLADEPGGPVLAAAWGTAHGRVDGGNFTDQVAGGQELDATFWLSEAGYRDDATRAIRATDGSVWSPGKQAATDPAQPELHLRIRSPEGAVPTPDVRSWAPPGDLPDDSYSQVSDFEQRFPFENTRFGGTGAVVVSATSLAPAGLTELDVVVVSPGGVDVGNATVRPDVTRMGGDAARVEFPLTDFGVYTVRLTGRMTLAKFSVAATLTPTDSLDLDFWWDRVAFGEAAKATMSHCVEEVSLNGLSGTSASVGRAPPPTYPVAAAVLAVVGAVTAVAVALKLVAHVRANSTFKRTRGQ